MFNGTFENEKLAPNEATDHAVTSAANINRSFQNARETNSAGYSKIWGAKVPSMGGSSAYEPAVFISYAWGDEREKIVNQIDESLQKRDIKIIRDKRDLGFKGSIKEFMERLGRGNCVIVVISDKYLRSSNCMFELIEIAENKEFYKRVFPIVLADAAIYDPVKMLDYVRYWESKNDELDEAMKTVGQANLQGIRDERDLYNRIREKFSGLTSILKDMNALTPEIHQDANFDILYDAIEERILSTRSVETNQSMNMLSSPIEVAENAENQSTIASVPTVSTDEPRTVLISQLKALENYQSKLKKYIEGYLESSECWAECANARSLLEKNRYKVTKGQSLDPDDWNEVLSSLDKPSVNLVFPDVPIFGGFLQSTDKFRKDLNKTRHAVQKIVKSYKASPETSEISDVLDDAIKSISAAMSEAKAIMDKCGQYAHDESEHIKSFVDMIVGPQKGQELLTATESRSHAGPKQNVIEKQGLWRVARKQGKQLYSETEY